METVEALCDTIALLNLGKCILEGKLSEVKEKFKKNIFRIEGEGTLPQNSKFYKIISHTYNNNKLTADIQLRSDFNSNDLLQEILPHVKIGGFNELLPSMNEIFISQVEKSLKKNNE